MGALTDTENVIIGTICGTADTTLLQSTNYWKNAKQQGLPFTLNPAVLYRGYTANVVNNGFCVGSQFFLNGLVRKLLLRGEDRTMSDAEKIGCGFSAGALSGIVCGPIELVMIQQQRSGLSMGATISEIVGGGASSIFRGTLGMMAREGIYCGGYLGIMPVARRKIRESNPYGLGATEDTARLAATFIAGPICSFLSHPADTLKTCMQGDLYQKRFKGYGHTAGAPRPSAPPREPTATGNAEISAAARRASRGRTNARATAQAS